MGLPQNLQYSNILKLVAETGKRCTVFDLETTAFRGAPNFGIVECAFMTASPMLKGKAVFVSELVNPEKPISASASRVHGITDSMVASAPAWGTKFAPVLDKVAKEHITVGFNIRNFDCPAVIEQNSRYGIATEAFGHVVDLREIYRKKAGQSKGTLADACAEFGVTFKGPAHRALGDVIASLELFDAMLGRYGLDVGAVDTSTLSPPAKQKGASSPRRQPLDELVSRVTELILFESTRDLLSLSEKLGVPEPEVSMAISKAIDTGAFLPDSFAREEVQAWLDIRVESAIKRVWKEGVPGHLKPLMALLGQANRDKVKLDYIQLRIALLRKGFRWSSLAEPAVA